MTLCRRILPLSASALLLLTSGCGPDAVKGLSRGGNA